MGRKAANPQQKINIPRLTEGAHSGEAGDVELAFCVKLVLIVFVIVRIVQRLRIFRRAPHPQDQHVALLGLDRARRHNRGGLFQAERAAVVQEHRRLVVPGFMAALYQGRAVECAQAGYGDIEQRGTLGQAGSPTIVHRFKGRRGAFNDGDFIVHSKKLQLAYDTTKPLDSSLRFHGFNSAEFAFYSYR